MLTITDPNIVSFNGICQYGPKVNGESQYLDEVSASSVSDCRSKCNDRDGCTAVTYTGNGDCYLYKGGPYTFGDKSPGYTCYLKSGILTLFVVVVIPILR